MEENFNWTGWRPQAEAQESHLADLRASVELAQRFPPITEQLLRGLAESFPAACSAPRPHDTHADCMRHAGQAEVLQFLAEVMALQRTED